jgi:hypothetical protein
VADSRVITKAMTLCGIKKDCAILAFEIQWRSPRWELLRIFQQKKKGKFFRLPVTFQLCESHSTRVKSPWLQIFLHYLTRLNK